jgi:hypothetical protein
MFLIPISPRQKVKDFRGRWPVCALITLTALAAAGWSSERADLT